MEKNSVLIPRQPFLVMTTDRYLKKTFYKYGVSHFYQMEVAENKSLAVHIPDCCVDIMFYCNKSNNDRGADIVGSRLKPLSIPMRAGYSYFGIRFMPGFVPPMLHIRMADVFDQTISLKDEMQKNCWCDEILEKCVFEERIDVFWEHYLPKYKSRKVPSGKERLVEYVVDKNISSKWTVLLKNLAEETKYSERYINRIFKESIGITPKKFARIIRFQNAIQDFEAGMNPTEISYQLNYYDCAHMVKEFREMCGMSPSELKSRLDNVDFYNKLVVL